MHAIVLAGGLGTRLRGAVPELPKPMAPVGGRPFLELVLDRLVEAGFEAAVLAVGYRHEAIRAHFGDAYRGLPLRWSVESEPLGTGGAVRLAWGMAATPEIFLLNGDTYVEVDYRSMFDAHRGHGAHLTMAVCRVADAGRYGAVVLEGERVRGFREKGQAGPGWVNAGVYVAGAGLRQRFPDTDAFSFEHDVLMPGVNALRPLAFVTRGRFIDIGVPDDYARAQTLLAGGTG